MSSCQIDNASREIPGTVARSDSVRVAGTKRHFFSPDHLDVPQSITHVNTKRIFSQRPAPMVTGTDSGATQTRIAFESTQKCSVLPQSTGRVCSSCKGEFQTPQAANADYSEEDFVLLPPPLKKLRNDTRPREEKFLRYPRFITPSSFRPIISASSSVHGKREVIGGIFLSFDLEEESEEEITESSDTYRPISLTIPFRPSKINIFRSSIDFEA